MICFLSHPYSMLLLSLPTVMFRRSPNRRSRSKLLRQQIHFPININIKFAMWRLAEFAIVAWPLATSGVWRSYTVKKRLATFPFPDEMSLTELCLGWNNLIIPAEGEFGEWIIPAQGEFGKWHPGCGQECRKPFFYDVGDSFLSHTTVMKPERSSI